MPREKYLKGADKVRRIFGALSAEMADEITAAINQSMAEMKRDMQVLVPRDQGDLAGDIGSEIIVTSRGVTGRVFAGTNKETAITARVQEFGRAAGPGEHPGHGKQSFFFTIWDARRKRIRGRMARAMRKAAKSVVRRHG